MTRIAGFLPDAVPEPLGWGSLGTANEYGYFYVASFLDFERTALPPPNRTGALTARLHQASIGTARLFGSPIPMYDGIFCHVDSLETRWQVLFAKMLWQAWRRDKITNGPSDEIDAAIAAIIHHVVPRLLDELEKDGNKVEPCFIHGDLWEGNFGTEVSSGNVFIFDSNGYYAHYEMEFALWRTKHHQMHSKDYCIEYFKHGQPSEPVEEFEDRLKLYGLKALLMYSATTPGHITRSR
jgi:protein-ribulosamine 3-kinase